MDIAFLYMYMLTVPPIEEGVQDQDQVFVVSSSPPSAILSALSSSPACSLPTSMENIVPVIDIWLYAIYMFTFIAASLVPSVARPSSQSHTSWRSAPASGIGELVVVVLGEPELRVRRDRRESKSFGIFSEQDSLYLSPC